MYTYSLIAAVVMLVGIVIMILMFERKRAKQIEHDLRSKGRHRASPWDDDERPAG